MKLLFDFFPIFTFFIAFKLGGIYVATGASIAASFVQVGWHWLRTRRFERMHLITLATIVVLGGLTLALHNDTFIKWKPTIVDWVFAGLLLGSHYVGKQPLLQRMLGQQVAVPTAVWRRINIAWGLFFALMGALNIYVAFYYRLDLNEVARQQIWVDFKVFGMLGLTLAFTVAQAFYLARHLANTEKGKA